MRDEYPDEEGPSQEDEALANAGGQRDYARPRNLKLEALLADWAERNDFRFELQHGQKKSVARLDRRAT